MSEADAAAAGAQGTAAGIPFGRQVWEIARKEVLQHIRTKRLLVIAAFFFLSLQLITIVFPLSFGSDFEDPGEGEASWENRFLNIQLNASLLGGMFALQLVCIVLTADAVCSEWGGKTIFLLLSKPVSRTAFVVGKYVGSLLAIVPAVSLLYTAQYLIMQAVYPGSPTLTEWAAFAGALGLLGLGAAAVASIALLFSALTRSNLVALMFTLLSVFLLFPIVAAIGDIQLEVDEEQRRGDADDSDWKYDWSHYLTPSAPMAAAGPLLLVEEGNEHDFAFGGLLPQNPPERVALAIASSVGFIALCVGLAVLVVNRRDFE